jgi:hypothetical protein
MLTKFQKEKKRYSLPGFHKPFKVVQHKFRTFPSHRKKKSSAPLSQSQQHWYVQTRTDSRDGLDTKFVNLVRHCFNWLRILWDLHCRLWRTDIGLIYMGYVNLWLWASLYDVSNIFLWYGYNSVYASLHNSHPMLNPADSRITLAKDRSSHPSAN